MPPPRRSAAMPPPPPAPIMDDDAAPQMGDRCCVYVEQCSDFFRPNIVDPMVGGWHPATVVHVDKLLSTSAANLDNNDERPVYDVTVASDFFSGKKRFHFPSPSNQLLLMVPSDEPYRSLSLRYRGNNNHVTFQAQPEALYPGDLVFARYQAGDKYYRGRVVAAYEEEDDDDEDVNNNGVSVVLPTTRQEGTGKVGSEPTRRRRGKRWLCSIAYDGGGRGTSETNVPFQDGSDDDKESDDDDDTNGSKDDDNFDDNDFDSDDDDDGDSDVHDSDDERPVSHIAPKAKPYVYLVQRGYDDVHWIQLELTRMYDSRELLPLTIDQQVPVDPPPDFVASAKSPSWHVLPVALAQLENRGRRSDSDPGPSTTTSASSSGLPEFAYFRYEDVVKCVYDGAWKRHRANRQLNNVEWPSQRSIQKKSGKKSKKKRNRAVVVVNKSKT